MKKYTPLSLALAGLLVASGAGTAVAVNGVEKPAPQQCLSDYMGDDNDAQWDKLETFLQTNYARTEVNADYLEACDKTSEQPAPEPTTDPTTEPTEEPTVAPEPEPTEDPAPEPEPTEEPTGPTLTDASVVATDDNRIVLTGKVTGVEGELTFRASAYEFGTQAGYPVQVTPAADGTIRAEVEDFNNTDPQFWQLEVGGSTWTHGEVFASGEIGAEAPAPEPTTDPQPEPTTPPATGGDTTGGTGGALTDRTFQSFTSAGLTSDYHVYAEGIDTSKPVGILMYGDGSGGYGFDNPTGSYLIGGATGLAATAQKHNMILVVPEAPAPGCDGTDNCWYDSTHAKKAQWSSDLMTRIKGQYDIDLGRVVIGGYSSGAQWTTQSFLPAHGEAQSVDLAVPIAYGGAPRSPMQATADWKNDLVVSFDTGSNDEAYSTASWGALGGRAWYRDNGFTTDWEQSTKGHSRSGEFGGILDREISEHLN